MVCNGGGGSQRWFLNGSLEKVTGLQSLELTGYLSRKVAENSCNSCTSKYNGKHGMKPSKDFISFKHLHYVGLHFFDFWSSDQWLFPSRNKFDHVFLHCPFPSALKLNSLGSLLIDLYCFSVHFLPNTPNTLVLLLVFLPLFFTQFICLVQVHEPLDL